jgi:glycosyltransferase involved in cell wall biosynthesis
MRILELLASPVWTGPAEPMASVAAELVRRGHSVEMAVDTLRFGDLAGRLREMGFAVHDELGLSAKSYPWRIALDLHRLTGVAKAFEIFHAHFSHDHLLAVIAARRSAARPRVVRTVHSSRSLRGRFLRGAVHRRTDGLIAVCQSYADQLLRRFRLDPRRVATIRGAVDANSFTPDGPDLRSELGIPAAAPVAGIVSRIKPERRHLDLVRAFAEVLRGLPEARLAIIGRGEALPAVKREVERLALGARILFAGYRSGDELRAAYRTLDVKVLLAEGNDGSCRAMLEAMACGRPVVAYRFGAPAETIIANVNGLLVEPGELAGLAKALTRLLSDRAHCARLGAQARAHVQRLFTESAQADAVESFLSEILRLPPI